MVDQYLSDTVKLPQQVRAFSDQIQSLQAAHPLAEYGWYPYDSLSSLTLASQLWREYGKPLEQEVRHEPILDAGCGDGHLALFFASLGLDVDAVDHPESNFNQMRGVRELKRLLSSRVEISSINLDETFRLPRSRYSIAFFLGILYHLKNPYQALELLARRAAYCFVSTRIAQVTRKAFLPMEEEPLAYLLTPREANNDPTNFWIFSSAGLLRLAERAGWTVCSSLRVGCSTNSDPVSPDADERIFLLLRSRIVFPGVAARLLEGWHPVESGGWRWTAKRFRFELDLGGLKPAEFAFDFYLPEQCVGEQGVNLSCMINGVFAGSSHFDHSGEQSFRGRIPATGDAGGLEFEFRVSNALQASGDDRRELGVIVTERADVMGIGLPLRLS